MTKKYLSLWVDKFMDVDPLWDGVWFVILALMLTTCSMDEMTRIWVQ